MLVNVFAFKYACNGTVHDTLSKETQLLRDKGYSIFGINDGRPIENHGPGMFDTRLVTIFYE